MLQKEIQHDIKKPHYPKLQSTEPGDLCLACLPDEHEYNRAVIMKTEGDKALCFFVDFGDEVVIPTSELKFIDDKFIAKLPFQSIQCSLYGVTPVLKEWQVEATDILYEYAVEPQTDIFRSLYVNVIDKGHSSIMNQSKYSVILKDGFGQRNVVINMLMIDCGLASPDSNPIEDFEIPVVGMETDCDEDIVRGKEEILDICRKTDEIEENFHPSKFE